MSERVIIDREAPPWAQRLQTDLNAAFLRLQPRAAGLSSTGLDARTYGVKADGSTNDTTALVAAFEAAQTLKRPLLLPEGVILVDSDRLTIGNGSNTAASTLPGMTLIGVGSRPNFGTGTIIRARTAGAVLLDVRGIIDGVRVSGITFDCNNLCATGVRTYSMNYSTWSDFAIVNWTSYGLFIDCRSGPAASTGWSSNNRFESFAITSGATVDYAAGLYLHGNVANNYDPHRNVFMCGVIQLPRRANPVYAAQLMFCDSNTFIEVDFSLYSGGAGYGIVFSEGGWPAYPQNNFFYGCSIISHLVSGTIGENFFMGFCTKDAETVPTDAKLIGFTDMGDYFGQWSHWFPGGIGLRDLQVGAADSGGAGFRMVRVAN